MSAFGGEADIGWMMPNDHAIQDYNQTIKLNPNDPTAFYYRGIANGMRGESDRAIQDFSQAIKISESRRRLVQSRPHI